MEYVHLKDHRGSGTEPVNVLSHYKYQDGLGYYETTRDTASHFFIDYLPKGTYVFEYSTRVAASRASTRPAVPQSSACTPRSSTATRRVSPWRLNRSGSADRNSRMRRLAPDPSRGNRMIPPRGAGSRWRRPRSGAARKTSAESRVNTPRTTKARWMPAIISPALAWNRSGMKNAVIERGHRDAEAQRHLLHRAGDAAAHAGVLLGQVGVDDRVHAR